MKRFFSLILSVLILAGCAALNNLDELLTLKDLAVDRDLQDKTVAEQNKQFEKLSEAIKSNAIKEYPNKKSCQREFGPPVYSTQLVQNGEHLERWLYRYAIQKTAKEKIYLYFDESNQLTYWEILNLKDSPDKPEKVVDVDPS